MNGCLQRMPNDGAVQADPQSNDAMLIPMFALLLLLENDPFWESLHQQAIVLYR